MASAKPTISSTVSPFMCSPTRSAAICESVHFPDKHFAHDRACLVARERFAVVHNPVQSFKDHAVQRLYGKKEDWEGMGFHGRAAQQSDQ